MIDSSVDNCSAIVTKNLCVPFSIVALLLPSLSATLQGMLIPNSSTPHSVWTARCLHLSVGIWNKAFEPLKAKMQVVVVEKYLWSGEARRALHLTAAYVALLKALQAKETFANQAIPLVAWDMSCKCHCSETLSLCAQNLKPGKQKGKALKAQTRAPGHLNYRCTEVQC